MEPYRLKRSMWSLCFIWPVHQFSRHSVLGNFDTLITWFADFAMESAAARLGIDISRPQFDQTTYVGRAKHFFVITNPLNILASASELEESKRIITEYRYNLHEVQCLLPPGKDSLVIWIITHCGNNNIAIICCYPQAIDSLPVQHTWSCVTVSGLPGCVCV